MWRCGFANRFYELSLCYPRFLRFEKLRHRSLWPPVHWRRRITANLDDSLDNSPHILTPSEIQPVRIQSPPIEAPWCPAISAATHRRTPGIADNEMFVQTKRAKRDLTQFREIVNFLTRVLIFDLTLWIRGVARFKQLRTLVRLECPRETLYPIVKHPHGQSGVPPFDLLLMTTVYLISSALTH